MMAASSRAGATVPAAMVCAAVVTAQYVAGKATRDALYLGHLSVTSLPVVVIISSAASLLLVLLSSRVLRRVLPGVFVPGLFVANALLLMAAWGLYSAAPRAAAVAVYLQFSALGPLLGSGFWLIASEQFDPRTAKRRFGQIAGVGTLGGLFGGLMAERLATVLPGHAMLPVLGALSLAGAWQIRRLARPDAHGDGTAIAATPELSAAPVRSGLDVLASAPYLRILAGVVFLGTIGATLVDYLFKVEAVTAYGRSESLLRFFATYYAATSVLTFIVQASCSRRALERFGLGVSIATPSVALMAGGLGALLAPGLRSITAVRAAESVSRGSLFRAGYELFYTPFPSADKRAAKSIVDVGVDRLGEAVGGGLIAVLLFVEPGPYNALLWAAMACSAGALVLTRQLRRGYTHTLERSLLTRAVAPDDSSEGDLTTRTVTLRTPFGAWPPGVQRSQTVDDSAPRSRDDTSAALGTEAELSQIVALRSRDPERVRAVLRSKERLPAALVAHVIPLVAWDSVARDAMAALQPVSDTHIGQLTDSLTDPTQPSAIHRRLARLLSASGSQRAVDGLLLGLDDPRFDVRFECARSLAAIREKHPTLHIDRERALEVARREVSVGRRVWEGQQLLDRLDDRASASPVEDVVRHRASRSLAHVFTLLSFALPSEPLRIAFRGLSTDDQILRGTALEYLEAALPPDIRERLWPFLEDRRPRRQSTRPREEILEDLLRSHQSIVLNLEELSQRTGRGTE